MVRMIAVLAVLTFANGLFADIPGPDGRSYGGNRAHRNWEEMQRRHKEEARAQGKIADLQIKVTRDDFVPRVVISHSLLARLAEHHLSKRTESQRLPEQMVIYFDQWRTIIGGLLLSAAVVLTGWRLCGRGWRWAPQIAVASLVLVMGTVVAAPPSNWPRLRFWRQQEQEPVVPQPANYTDVPIEISADPQFNGIVLKLVGDPFP